MSVTLVKVEKRNGEDINSLLKRFKKKVEKSNHIAELKDRRYFDTRYTIKSQPYYNLNRSDTFFLSPFDETILLDADYLMLDNSFDYVWNGVEDIRVNKAVKDLHHNINISGFDLRF